MSRPTLRRRTAAAAGALALVVCAAIAVDGRAPTVRERFEAAKTAEAEARAAAILVEASASTATEDRALRQVRRVAAQYEALVRRFPSSSYSDDALFQAGTLLEWLHGRFGRDADRTAAAKYLAWLVKEYPASKHLKDARLAARTLEQSAPRGDTPRAVVSAPSRPVKPAEVRASEAGSSPAAPVAPVALAPTSTPAGSGVTEPPSGPPVLRGISRAVLDGTVRVTLALDRETPFTHEILAGPPRAFVDLFGASAAEGLQDSAVKYDADAVRQVRVGRRPGALRVVLDLSEATRVSVYTLYNPYRVVIDADRAVTARSPRAPTATSSPPSSVPRIAPSATAARITSPRPTAPPVPVPEPLPAPVAVPSESAVVLTVESSAPADRLAPDAVPALYEPAAPDPSTTAPPRDAITPAAATTGTTSAEVSTASLPVPATPAPVAPVTAAPVAPATASPSANADGSFSLARQLGLGVARIVIDPGHGGHDPGTMANGSSEAKIVLDVALRLEKLLEREGLETVLTRRTDIFIPLEERTAIANRERADLFLSIHVNASRDPNARGLETYYLSFASNPDAETVAARENSTSAGSMHNLPSIVRAIALNNKLDESRDLAGMVQRALSSHLAKDSGRSRGIKKAPFVVLIGAAMPSVLAEIGFITNKTEAGLIKSPAHRQRIAEALRDAVVKYQRSLKRATTVATTTGR